MVNLLVNLVNQVQKRPDLNELSMLYVDASSVIYGMHMQNEHIPYM